MTSLDVKESGQIFIGTVSLERRSAERSVIGDVMYLSVYLVWQGPQVCWVLVSTGTSESEVSFITFSYSPTQKHTAARSRPQGDASSCADTHSQTRKYCRNVAAKGI